MGAFTNALEQWLDGSQKEDRARSTLAAAMLIEEEINELENKINQLSHQLELAHQKAKIDYDKLFEIWKQMEQNRLIILDRQDDIIQKLQGALLHAPELEEIYCKLLPYEYQELRHAYFQGNTRQIRRLSRKN